MGHLHILMTFCLTLLRPFRMMMADAKPKSSRGRKPTLTDSGRKRKKKETNALINRSRVYVGEQYNRWNELKKTLRLQTHSEVAKVLLDRYVHGVVLVKKMYIKEISSSLYNVSLFSISFGMDLSVVIPIHVHL